MINIKLIKMDMCGSDNHEVIITMDILQQERPKTENAIVTGVTFIRQLEREVINYENV